MRSLIATQNITLDGRIEMLDDWFDPATQADHEDLLETTNEMDAASDATLLGRRTFEDFRGFWRHREDGTGIGAYLDQVRKYVASSTLTDPGWENTTVLSGDLVTEVRGLKGQDGLDICVTGSVSVTHTLLRAGLIDELRLFVYPVVQGRGRALFPDGHSSAGLRALEARTFRGGVALLRYATH